MNASSLTRSDKLNHAAAEIAVDQREQTAVPQFGVDKKIRHVAPAKSLQDNFFLHELITDRAGPRTFDDVVVSGGQILRAVSNDALNQVPHSFGRDLPHRKRQKTRGRDGNQPNRTKIDRLETWVTLIDVMKDEVCMTLQQQFPGA